MSACFTKDHNSVSRCVAGETIIVPVRAHVGDLDSIYTLNEVGTFVWDRIDGWTPVQAIVAAVCGAYDVPPQEAARDVSALLDDLEAAGLVHPAEAPGS